MGIYFLSLICLCMLCLKRKLCKEKQKQRGLENMCGLRVKNVCLSEHKNNVLNYKVQSLFIEAIRLYKIGTDGQGLNIDASFCEKVKKGVPYRHLKAVGPKPKRRKFGPFKVPFGTPKVPNGVLGCRTHFRVRVRFGLSFYGFLI